jgi:hypothetical protein
VNIVVMSARPRGVGDVPHRIVSQQIQKVIVQKSTTGEPRYRMHIVRPGTFDALRSCLEGLRGKPVMVHFDLHGEIGRDDKMYVSRSFFQQLRKQGQRASCL